MLEVLEKQMTDDERAAAFQALGKDLGAEAEKLWTRYAELELKGLRKPALQALGEFIAKMQQSDARADWTWRFCEAAARVLGDRWPSASLPIRQPLWRELLLPTLVDAYRSGRVGAAAHIGLLNPPGEALALHDVSTDPLDLLREALSADPGDHLVRQKLMSDLHRRMEYVIHEAPHHGVLMADIEEDVRWANELEELAREAGEERRYANFIFRYRYYTTAWDDYIQRGDEYDSFVNFLSLTAPYASLKDVVRRMDRLPLDD